MQPVTMCFPGRPREQRTSQSSKVQGALHPTRARHETRHAALAPAGPKRNLQTALEMEDAFTQPLAATKVPTLPLCHAAALACVNYTCPQASVLPVQLLRRPQFNRSVVQQSRQVALQEACHNHSGIPRTWEDLSPAEQSAVAQRIIVNEDHKLLFCTVPLTAIGPWMKVFYLLGPGRDLKDAGHIPASELANRGNFIFLSSFSPSEQAEMMSTYLKFMVARHPFLRVAVAYKMKFEADNKFFHERYGKEIVQRYRPGATGKEKGSDVKFPEFIEYLLEQGEEGEMNEHWQPLHALCRPCEVGYDFILHHETLAKDASELLAQARLTSRVPSLPTDAWDHISIQYAHNLFQYITPAWIGKLVQKYREDFAMFSYASLF